MSSAQSKNTVKYIYKSNPPNPLPLYYIKWEKNIRKIQNNNVLTRYSDRKFNISCDYKKVARTKPPSPYNLFRLFAGVRFAPRHVIEIALETNTSPLDESKLSAPLPHTKDICASNYLYLLKG